MPPLKQPGRVEFIALAALLMSTAAMSIDFVLPALGILVNDICGRTPACGIDWHHPIRLR